MSTERRPRVVSLDSRDIPRGYELETRVEVPAEDGSTTLIHTFHREVDFGESYLTVNHRSRGFEPAETVLIFGRKGPVEGDFRSDETEMLVLRIDGTVQRTEQSVKTWLKADEIRERMREKYRAGIAEGRTPDEIFREISAEDYGSANA
jgi:hypothetical protein